MKIQTPAEMEAVMIKNLKSKTGYDVQDWMDIMKYSGVESKKDLVKWLKEIRKIKHGDAHLLMQIFFNGGKGVYSDPDALLRAQFSKSPELFPIYCASIEFLNNNFEGIRIGICKSYVSILGKNQFAVLIVKSKKMRIGLALKNEPYDDFIIEAKNLSSSDKITHQIVINDIGGLNNELLKYLNQAYITFGK